MTEFMPVVLQHAGHSRTVVGYEVQKDGEYNLLVFDPSKYVRSLPLDPSSRTSHGQPPDHYDPRYALLRLERRMGLARVHMLQGTENS